VVIAKLPPELASHFEKLPWARQRNGVLVASAAEDCSSGRFITLSFRSKWQVLVPNHNDRLQQFGKVYSVAVTGL